MSIASKYLGKLSKREVIEVLPFQVFYSEMRKSNEEIKKLKDKNNLLAVQQTTSS